MAMIAIMEFILMILFGVLAGIIGGLLGIGGCCVMLPALYFIFGYPLPIAIGTTITAVIVTATSGAIAHIRIKNVDWQTAGIVALSGGVGSLIGSLIFVYLAENVKLLNAILGIVFLYVSIKMIYEGALRKKASMMEGKEVPGSALAKSVIGFSIGILTGIVGLGGGYALVPSFIYLLSSPVKIAVGTSLASFISMAVISGAFKIYQGYVNLIAAIALGIGTAIGAQIGARLVPKTPSWLIKLLFGIVFLYVSLKFILSALGI